MRDSKATDKRRKMREELERKEKMATSERTEEEVARMRLKVCVCVMVEYILVTEHRPKRWVHHPDKTSKA